MKAICLKGVCEHLGGKYADRLDRNILVHLKGNEPEGNYNRGTKSSEACHAQLFVIQYDILQRKLSRIF
jgi:hypothetical protein